METRTAMIAAAAAVALMTMTVSLFAAEQAPAAAPRKSEPIYGYRMMSDHERNEYRERMRNARSADERQALRDEHHKRMTERARERGVTPPEQHGPRSGMGPHGPRADGRGPDHGMGPGARGNCAAGEECPGPGGGRGPGYGKGPGGQGMGPGYGRGPCAAGEECAGPGGGKGPGYGPRGECPAGQECRGPGAGRGPAPRQ